MPKTGGMWVSRFLKKLDSSFKRPKHLVKYNKHGFRELTDFHLPSKLVGPEYYKFGFIRNPVSWYWSMFNFQQKRSMRNENALFDIMISDASELIEQEKGNKINSSSSFGWPKMTKESLEFIYESSKEIYDKFEYERKKQ